MVILGDCYIGIGDAYVIEDEDPDCYMDSMPTTPDTSITDGEGEIGNPSSPGSASLKAKERSSPDPRPISSKNGPKIGKRVQTGLVGDNCFFMHVAAMVDANDSAFCYRWYKESVHDQLMVCGYGTLLHICIIIIACN